jgi:hypothetical protein
VISAQALEEVTLLQPLGLRFWDGVTQSFVGDGLSVTAWPAANPNRALDATLNRSGVYSFRGLPGMREVESGAGDDAFWAAHPPSDDLVVQVLDPEGRFLPFQLRVQAPQRGIYRYPGTPDGLANSIPVFSMPSRTIPVNTAVVRAELYDHVNHCPAAWAVMDVSADGQPPVRGIADTLGRVQVALPYPEPRNFGIGSPLGPAGIKLQDQSWPVTVSVSYTRGPAPVPAIPDLGQVLSQSPATAWADTDLTQIFGGATLAFGQELILRSWQLGNSPPARIWTSTLSITPAGSPL